MKQNKLLIMILALVLLLSGCGGGSGSGGESASAQPEPAAEAGETEVEEPSENVIPTATYDADFDPYQAPPFQDSAFHADQAEGDDNVKVDLSQTESGYIGIAATSDKKLKCQVIMGENKYTYDMKGDGTPDIFPLQSGDGEYQIRVMENVTDNNYAQIYSTTCDVKMKDEFQPFIRPSTYVNYTEESACVKKAAELANNVPDEIGLVGAVYDYICATVTYDTEKASTVQSGYLPDPDETLSTGKGICFDYAVLAASMLRSQGIPTRMIFGYVSPDDLYHAWNMFYTEETGWVTVKFEVQKESWNRMDLTFSANGADADFIGDGSNYSDLYYY